MNWYILILVVVVAIIAAAIFFKGTEKQKKAVKEWLLFAVAQAEKELGSGTGQLKLRYVYDVFVSKFKIAKLIPFETFSKWVDEALDQLENMLKSNDKAAAYIEGVEK